MASPVRLFLPRLFKFLGLGVLGAAAVVVATAALTAQPPPPESGGSGWATISPVPSRPVAAFIGDAMTSGVGASENSKQWTSLLSAKEGWQEVNLALGGTGYFEAAGPSGCGKSYCPNFQVTASDAVSRQADIVVVSGGASDRVADIGDVTDAVRATYQKIREGLPDAKIIAVGPGTKDPTEKVIAIDAAVRKASRAVGAVYVSLLKPQIFTGSMILSDGVNVDDAGHAAIAKRVEAALK